MKLFFRKSGNGPPLIILHGLFGSSDNWITIAKSLGDYFTVYLPDQRNHGQSPHSDIHDYASMREDLYELISDLKLRKVFIAGHSMGGKTAVSFALKYPEMINGLLIADISPFANEERMLFAYNQHITILRTILSIDLSAVRSRVEVESLLTERISDEKVRGFILKNLQRSTGNIFTWKLNAQSLLDNLDKIMEGIDLEEGYSNPVTGFPVIFLKARNSDYLPPSDMKNIKRAFPSLEFEEVPDAGHWIHADRPDEVVKNIIRLIDGN
jgi:esterase